MPPSNEDDSEAPVLDDELDAFLERLGVHFDLKRYSGRPWNPCYERWRARFQYVDNAGNTHILRIYRWVRVLPRQDQGTSAYQILSGRVRAMPDNYDQFCSKYGYAPKSLMARAEYEAEQQEVREIQQFFETVATEHPNAMMFEMLARI